jgi:hypothetical protein
VSSFRLTSLCYLSASIFAGFYPAAAVAVPVCQTGSLASYVALDAGGGCTIGQLTFLQFNDPSPTTTGSPTVANASQILLTPVQTAAGAAGFAFSASSGETNLFAISSHWGTTAVTYHIDYAVDPAPIIAGSGMSLDPPFGNSSASQLYCIGSSFPGCPGGQEYPQSVTTASPTSTITFASPTSFVEIETGISLLATPGHPAGFDSLNAVIDTVPTPEPALLPLTACGLGLLFLARLKRKRA